MQKIETGVELFVVKVNLPYTAVDGGLTIVFKDTTINSCDISTLNHKKRQTEQCFIPIFWMRMKDKFDVEVLL